MVAAVSGTGTAITDVPTPCRYDVFYHLSRIQSLVGRERLKVKEIRSVFTKQTYSKNERIHLFRMNVLSY